MKWVETKIVTPWLRDRSISNSQNRSRASGSTPEVGSSRISISGSCTTATASDEALADAERQVGGLLVDMVLQAEIADQGCQPPGDVSGSGWFSARW